MRRSAERAIVAYAQMLGSPTIEDRDETIADKIGDEEDCKSLIGVLKLRWLRLQVAAFCGPSPGLASTCTLSDIPMFYPARLGVMSLVD